jgi:hypothetical protein
MLQKNRRQEMNLSIKLEHFDIKNVLFMELILNEVMNGLFSNIIYTDSNVIFSGIYIQLPFICDENRNIVTQQVVQLENKLIEQYKIFFNVIKDPLYNNKFYFHDTINSIPYILKISGIWETESQFGINRKIIQTTTK